MKKIAFFLLGFLFVQLSFGQTTIASQDFEATPAAPTMTFIATDFGTPTNNGGFSSGVLPSGNRPVGSNLYASGAQGYRVVPSASSLAGQALTFSAVNTTGYTGIQVSYRVAAMSIGTTNGGMDTNVGIDQVLLEVSPDGGTTWFQQSRVNISGTLNNAAWDFAGATGTGTRTYLANNSSTTHSTSPTATPQTVTGTAAITTVIVTNLPAVPNLQVRITPQTNSTSEAWYIDDVIITGTPVAGPDTTPPVVSTLTPLDDATGVSITGDLSFAFDEIVTKGTGNILIRRTSDDSIFETIDVATAAVSVSGTIVTINPAGIFDNTTGYYLEIPATAFKDAANNFYTGISGATTWNFTTVAISFIALADNGTQVATAVLAQGATEHVLHKFSLAVTSVNTALTGIQVTTAGTYATADLTNLRVRYSTDAILNVTDATLSTYTSVPTAGTLTFLSFVSQAINAGSTGYIFITADVAETATLGNTISVGAVTTAQLTFSGGIKSGSTSAGGAQAVVAKIITFDFNALAGNEATANSNFNNANLTASTISRGAGLTAAANGARFNSQNWALTDIATAITNNDYVEFTITPNAGYQFSVSSLVFNIMRSGTSFTGIALRNSEDNYASNLDAEKAIADNADSTEIITFSFSQPNSSTPVTYRLYGWAEATGGSGGFEGTGNDIIVTGTTEATSTTWTGTTSTSWTDTLNWNNGLPSTTTDVVIGTGTGTFQPIITSDVKIKSLTLSASTTLTVTSGFNLTVIGAAINGGTMTIENNANLVQETGSTYSGSGNIIVNRSSNALSRLDFTLWSSPVTGTQTLAQFSPLTSSNRFFTFDETYTTGAVNGRYNETAPTNTFAVGTGYLIRMPNENPASLGTATPYYLGSAAITYEGTFTGVPNNGTVTKAITNAASGFNAVGNPYPSTIDALVFINTNTANIESSLYFWRKANAATGSAYAVYNPMGGTAATPSSALPNATIQVGQGFFVKAKSTSSVNFNNAMRVANNSNQFFRTNNTQKDRLWLNLTNTAGVFSQTLIGFTADASQGIDIFDAKYINDSPVALTSQINDEEYSIQGRQAFTAKDIVALNFKTDAAGEYTIALNNVDGLFANGQNIFLVDSKTGTETNLKNGAYTFSATTGADNTRFKLTFESTLSVDSPTFNDNNGFVYKNNGALHVNARTTEIKSVSVYDIQGRVISQLNNVNATNATINNLRPNQVLIVKIIGADNAQVTKKVVY